MCIHLKFTPYIPPGVDMYSYLYKYCKYGPKEKLLNCKGNVIQA